MFYPKVLTNVFRRAYCFCRAADIPKGAGKSVHAERFHDQNQAQQFLKNFSVPQSYWRRFLQASNDSLTVQRLDESAVSKKLAESLVKGKLRVYKVPQSISQRKLSSISSRGKDGFRYSIEPSDILFLENPAQVLSVQTPRAVEEILAKVNPDPKELRPLLRSINIPQADTIDEEEVLFLTKQAIIENRLQITRTQIPPPRTAQKTESAVNTPGNKKPSLGPEATKSKTWFQLKLIDEAGEPLSGIDFSIRVDGENKQLSTGGDGSIQVKDVFDRFASAKIVDAQQIADVVEPRWESPRKESETKAASQSLIGLIGKLSAFSVKNEIEHVVVVKPPQGQLFVQLKDKHGRVAHANCEYSIEGPLSFSGTTNDNGIFQHPDVPMGEYILNISPIFFEGTEDEKTDSFSSPLVVLEKEATEPQVRLLGLAPRSELVRIRGMLFDTNKSFLLPNAVRHIEDLHELYNLNNPGELLIVGHTDTTGEPDINDPLSLERADNVKAFIEDNVDAWLNMYDSAATAKGKWGAREDRLMIISMSDFSSALAGNDLVKWFQKTRGLKVDGIAGPNTRTQLITEYMGLDGIKLEDVPELDLTISTHGCGENFPLDVSGEALDSNPEDEKEDRLDRRVELFFFDKEFGIIPKPASADGDQYTFWREHASFELEHIVEHKKKNVTVIEFHDALFRTNSCVILPEGESPGTEHKAITSVGLIAGTLRFLEEHPGKKLFIAGHTDTTGTEDFNQTLSEERSKCSLAILEGKREEFVDLVNNRHTVADYKQILSWCTAFSDLFDCDPGAIDDNASTGVKPLTKFQEQFNKNKIELGSKANDLKPDGKIGPLTWGAIFDVYQLGIREELDEDVEKVNELRKKIVFVDDKRKALGFSEYHPVDAVGRDNVRSQTNRRVEFLFFDSGEEPDLILAENNPDISELYVASEFVHKGIDMVSAKPWKAKWVEDLAQMSKPCTMQIAAPGIPAGIPVTITVNAVGHQGVIGSVQTQSLSNLIEAKFDEWEAPEGISSQQLKAGQAFPEVEFSFAVEGGGRLVEARKPIPYSDRLFITLVMNEEEDTPLANEPYTIATPWGTRKGVTNDEGVLDEKGLAPGGATVILRDSTLVSLGELSPGWHLNG